MLRITRIKLKNFGSVIEETVSLESTVTVFAGTGDNGDGKSTFLKAIYLNLMDMFDGTVKDYIRWGEKSFDNEIHFLFNGVQCVSKVHGTKSGNQRHLTIGDEVITESTAVLERLKEMLDPKMLEASAVMREGQVDVVTTTPAQRRDLLKNVFDLNFTDQIEKLEQERDEFKEALEGTERKVYLLENKVYVDPTPPAKPEEEETEERLKELLSHAQQKWATAQSQVDAYNRAVAQVEALQRDLQNAQNQLSREQSTLQTLESRKDALRAKSNEQRDVEAELTPWKTAIEERKSELSQIILPRTAPTWLPPYDTSTRDQLVQEIPTLNSHIQMLREKIEAAKGGVCSQCGQAIPPKDTTELEEALKLAVSKLEKSQNLLDAENKAIAEHSVKSKEAMQKVEEYNALLQEHYQAKSALELAEQSLTSQRESLLREQARTKEDAQSALVQIDEDIARQSESITSTERSITEKTESLTKAQADVPAEPTALNNNIADEINSFQARIHALQVYSAQLATYHENVTRLEKEKATDQDTLENLVKERNSQQKEVKAFDEAITKLKNELPQYILKKLTKQLENIANSMLARTYSKQFIKFKPSKTSLKLVYGEMEQDCKLASGFEKAVFSLAFKVALSQSNGNRLLILDEMDATASIDNSRKVYQYILDQLIAQGYIDQVICITHKAATLDLLELDYGATIYRMEKGEIVG